MNGRRRRECARIVAVALLAASGCSAGESTRPAVPAPAQPGALVWTFAPLSGSASANTGSIVLHDTRRALPIGSEALVVYQAAACSTIPCPSATVVPPDHFAAADPAIVALSATDPLSGSFAVPAPTGGTYVALKGYGTTTLSAERGSTVLATTRVTTYRMADLSCDIGSGTNGYTFAADGTATRAASPSTADVYFTGPLQAGVTDCTNPAFASATTSPLIFPSGATIVTLDAADPNAAFAALTPSAWRADFTTMPSAPPATPYAIVFRAQSGATVKLTAPGIYEAAPAGAAAFPY